MIEFINLEGQYAQIKQEINEAIAHVLARQWFVLGPEVEQFEKEFAEFCNAKYAVGVNSGTDALSIALHARNIGLGDEVITVPNTAIPTAAAIRDVGATPVFVDIDDSTYNINVSKIEARITAKTRAIIPVHLYGNPCLMDEITSIAQKHNLVVIEDACQAHGSKYKNQMVGTFGDFGCFSFYPSKNLGGYGDGGMILCKTKDDCELLKRLRFYGQSTRYICEHHGRNSRLDELQAAVLRVKLKHLNDWNKVRRSIAAAYCSLINNNNIILPKQTDGGEHVFHLFVIRSSKRDLLRKYLEENGIKTEIHYPTPLHLQKGYSFLNIKECSYPVAEKVMKEILSIPIYPELGEEQIKQVADKINTFK